MPSTYSPNLRIELIANGEQSGTWGTTTNTNLGTLIEDAISGYVSVPITLADQALTVSNGVADQSRNMVVNLTTTTGADFNVYIPPAEKVYIIRNASSFNATIYCGTSINPPGNTTAAGAGVTIPSGRETLVFSDATNVIPAVDYLSTLSLGTALPLTSGGTGSATASGARTNLGLGTIATQNANAVTITGGSITGITDLAVADGGTGASDASGARTNLGLGTIATQNSNAVTITGGSITGITDLAVADGGTGASDASGARTNLGLGTIATQAANSVSITGGSITGITDLAVADGGTGASDASGARTNLGLVIGTNVPSPTGTGASGTWGISINGNANTATSAVSLVTTNFSIVESGGTLYFKYGTTNVASLDASGNLTVLANVTGYGTP
jgi:hypothetical protein